MVVGLVFRAAIWVKTLSVFIRRFIGLELFLVNYLGDYLLLVVLIFNQVEEPAEFMVHKVHLSRRCAMSSGVKRV